MEKKPKSTYDKLKQLKLRLTAPNKPASIPELAEYMSCDMRTIYRHLKTLEKENCGLQKDKTAKKFFIQPTSAWRPPEKILKGLKSAQKILDDMGSTPQGQNVKRAIDFLQGEELPEETSSQAISTDENFIVDLGPFSEFSENVINRTTRINSVLNAIKQRQKLLISYQSAHDGAEKKHKILPLKLILRIDTVYLIAKTEDEEGKISDKGFQFAFRRIKTIQRLNEFFPEQNFDYKKFFESCYGRFNGSSSPKIKLLLEIKSEWLQAYLKESHFNPPIKIKKQKPFTVELSLYDTLDLESWLFSILPDVKILEPASIKEKMKNKLKAANEAL